MRAEGPPDLNAVGNEAVMQRPDSRGSDLVPPESAFNAANRVSPAKTWLAAERKCQE